MNSIWPFFGSAVYSFELKKLAFVWEVSFLSDSLRALFYVARMTSGRIFFAACLETWNIINFYNFEVVCCHCPQPGCLTLGKKWLSFGANWHKIRPVSLIEFNFSVHSGGDNGENLWLRAKIKILRMKFQVNIAHFPSPFSIVLPSARSILLLCFNKSNNIGRRNNNRFRHSRQSIKKMQKEEANKNGAHIFDGFYC